MTHNGLPEKKGVLESPVGGIVVGVVPGSGLALLGVSVNIIHMTQLQKNVVVSMILIMMEQPKAFQGATYNRRQTIKS